MWESKHSASIKYFLFCFSIFHFNRFIHSIESSLCSMDFTAQRQHSLKCLFWSGIVLYFDMAKRLPQHCWICVYFIYGLKTVSKTMMNITFLVVNVTFLVVNVTFLVANVTFFQWWRLHFWLQNSSSITWPGSWNLYCIKKCNFHRSKM